jgi:hypothetical protein
MFCGVSVSVSTHQVSSYILVRLRLACFDYEHELAVRDLQVTCWIETGNSTAYKHDEGMRTNLGINTLQTTEQETDVMLCSEHYYWRKVKHYCHHSHQAVLLVLTVQLGW